MINMILSWGNYGKSNENRSKILSIASTIGILFNFSLAILKIILFFFTGSISILVDSINNATDSLSGVIVLVGTKLSEKPSDSIHPHGYGRIEYVSALTISILIFAIGLKFMNVSIYRIIHPKPLIFAFPSIVLILISIVIKIYMVYFYSKISKTIHSLPLKAQSKDYLCDVFVTSVIFVSMIIYKKLDFTVDGYIGFLISLLVMYYGYNLIRESLSELIGRVPEDYVRSLKDKIISYENILGVHDIVIANYGIKKVYITVDVEMDYKLTLMEAHKIIDKVEQHIQKEFGCILSIHIDPVGMYSEQEALAVAIIESYMSSDGRIESFHDLSCEDNLLRVDIVVDGNKVSEKQSNMLKSDLEKELFKSIVCDYEITVDRCF